MPLCAPRFPLLVCLDSGGQPGLRFASGKPAGPHRYVYVRRVWPRAYGT